MLVSDVTLDSAEVHQQLERVLHSRVFERAHRSQRFLRYLVESALAQPPVVNKEYTIAIDVFDRDASYDPTVDATVRVEASRLRSRLREYYDTDGRADPWVIGLPKGGYAVVLTRSPADENPILAIAAMAEPGAARAVALLPDQQTSPGQSGHSEQNVRRNYVLAACIAIALLAALVLGWRHRSATRQVSAPGTASLAILPLANRTGDPSLGYITDGLTDDLIRQLSQVPALKLMAPATMFRYRDRTGDADAVGKALHVDTVMVGELQRTPEHLFLTVEASRTSDGSLLLDRKYIADVGDLRQVQAEVQQDLIRTLNVESSAVDPGRAQHSVSSSPQAYQEFLEGDALARTAVPQELHMALAHYEAAVKLDPQFDLAWSALAADHLLLGLYFEPPRQHMPLARQYAERALKINPALGEAHGSLGLVYLVYDWNVPAAQSEMHQAGAEAAAVSALACTVHLIQNSGRSHRAEEMLETMLTYNPQSAALISELGCVDFYRGDYAGAIHYYREGLEVDPQSPVAYWGMGKTLNAQGKYAEAIEVLKSFKSKNGFEPPLLTAEIGYALGASGQRRQALAVIDGLNAEGRHIFVDPYLIAVIHASMNDRDAAYASLEKALDVRSSFAISLPSEPKWEPFRKDPRFNAITARMLHNRAG